MNIKFAKQIIPNPSGKYIYENSNFLNGECIVCEHPRTGSTHANTKLSHWKDGVFTPILRDYPDGLEDSFIIKWKDWYCLFAELKKVGGSQTDIAWFKSKRLDRDWIGLGSILKPTNKWFESYSVSSPAGILDGNFIDLFYEGRPPKPHLMDFHTGYARIDLIKEKVVYRKDIPISQDRIIPDDLRYKNGWYEFSCHTFEEGKGWFGFVYRSKSLESGWQHYYTQKYKGKPMGEIYWDGNDIYFWKKNFEGMWQVVADSNPKPPINGGNVKPIIELKNDLLTVTNAVSGEQYAWQVKYSGGGVTWFAFGDSVAVRNADKVDGNKFWCYPMSDKSALSNVVVYETDGESPIIPDPPTDSKNLEIAQQIIDLANKITK